MPEIVWNPFKDKKVALVGNANLRYNKEAIAFIDNHEVVARINEGVFINKHTHLGKKVDIGFFAHAWKWPLTDLTCTIVLNNKVALASPSVEKHLQQKLTTSKVDTSKYLSLPEWNTLDTIKNLNLTPPKNVPSSGALILNYLSYCNVAELNIFNFDWKKTPSFYDSLKKHTPTKMSEAALDVGRGVHHFAREAQYFTQLIENNKNWNLYIP
jgi:hypothetical protein